MNHSAVQHARRSEAPQPFKLSHDLHKLLRKLAEEVLEHAGITFISSLSAPLSPKNIHSFLDFTQLARGVLLREFEHIVDRTFSNKNKIGAMIAMHSSNESSTLSTFQPWNNDDSETISADQNSELREMVDAYNRRSLSRSPNKSPGRIHSSEMGSLSYTNSSSFRFDRSQSPQIEKYQRQKFYGMDNQPVESEFLAVDRGRAFPKTKKDFQWGVNKISPGPANYTPRHHKVSKPNALIR